MKRAALRCLIIANAIIAFHACASAQDIDVGKTEFQSGCGAISLIGFAQTRS
jgi:hypothetical protein